MKNIYLTVCLALLLVGVFAQDPFHKNILPGPGDSYLSAVSSNPFSTFVAVSYGDTSADGGFHIIKYDGFGALAWSKRITEPGIRTISLLKASGNGGCIFAGAYGHGFNLDSFYVARIDDGGSVWWCKNFNYSLSPTSLRPTNNIRDITEGFSFSDIMVAVRYWESNGSNGTGATFPYLIQLDGGGGNINWAQKYVPASGNQDEVFGITEVENSDYVMTGKAWTGGNWAVKLDDDGVLLWKRYYSTLMSGQGADKNIGLYPDSGYLHYNLLSSYSPNGRLLVTQVDPSTGVKTNGTMFSSTSSFVLNTSIPAIDGGVMVGGYRSDFPNTDLFYAHLSKNFSAINWNKAVYEPQLSAGMSGLSAAPSGGYFIGGNFDTSSNYYYTRYNAYLAKVDSLGNGVFCGSSSLTIGITSPTYTDDVYAVSDSVITDKILVNDLTAVVSAGYYAESTVVCATGIDDVPGEMSWTIYPNPADDALVVNTGYRSVADKLYLKVYDAVGKEIYASPVTSPQFRIPTSALANGIYFVKLGTNENSSVRQFVVIH